jgi:prepilin-type N-terminal cleavage/methylation domain-containing protein
MFNQKKLHGFSLVEITVTLTIIALLIGAVAAAQNMKRSLELKQVVDQVTAINKAITIFRGGVPSGYGAIPGDYILAETAFGQEAVGNKVDDDNGDGNGDGDNLIESSLSSPSRNERLLFWQHLAAAGLIAGSFDGSTDGPGGRPEGPIRNSIFGVSTTSVGSGSYANAVHIYISKFISSANNGILSTKEAYDIDLKYDDADPETGAIRAADGDNHTSGDCVSGSSPNQSYNLSNSGEEPCVLHFYEREYN